MNALSTALTFTAASPAPSSPAPAAQATKAGPPGYTGPADGLSHYNPQAARWLRPLNKLVMAAAVRKAVVGRENIPQSGAHMLAFNHQSYIDPTLVSSISDRDWRFMAAKEQFIGLLGQAMTAMGAFPVDRGKASSKPLDVSIDLLNDGKGVAIFPEGRIHEDGSIHELKEGAALVALRSKCETIVPGAIHFQEHTPGFGSKLLNYASAAAVTAAGLAIATAGGPALQVVSGAVTGLLTGVLAGGVAGAARTGFTSDLKDLGMAALKGAALGAVCGGVMGGAGAGLLGSPMLLAAPLSVGAGLTTLAIGKGLSHRDDVRVVVGRPIEVEPYRQMADKKQARAQLTEDLFKAMVALKEDAAKAPA